jgi:hypothetical protein
MSTSLLVSAQRLYRTKEKNIASMHIEVVIPDAGNKHSPRSHPTERGP